MAGLIVAFEGLDQSGKQTQADRLRDRVLATGRQARVFSFPEYDSPLGRELGLALQGSRDYDAELMQLLYVANRYERKSDLESARASGTIVICDRYVASSVAYGEAQGLDGAWLRDIQRHLPVPDVTVLLDMPAEESARRKTANRDRYEQDLHLLERVRESYLAQASRGDWTIVDATQDRNAATAAIGRAITPLLDRLPQ